MDKTNRIVLIAAGTITVLSVVAFVAFWAFFSWQMAEIDRDFEHTSQQYLNLVRGITPDQITAVSLNPWDCGSTPPVGVPREHWQELSELLAAAKPSDGAQGAADKIILVLEIDTVSGLHRLFLNTTWKEDQPVYLSYGTGPIVYLTGDGVWSWILALPQYQELLSKLAQETQEDKPNA